jgi:hypothetical protein
VAETKKDRGARGAPKGAKTTAIERAHAEATKAGDAAKRRAETLLDLIARRKETITEDFYDIGRALRELLQKKLYLALGYRSFEAMLEAREIMGATQARKLIQVVSTVSIETALKLGPEKAFALVQYAEATPEPDTPVSLLEGGAKIGKKAVAAASVREIVEATKAVRKKHTPRAKPDGAETAAEAAAQKGATWLKKRGIAGARIEHRRAKDQWLVRVELPVEMADKLFAK